jgi:hypothetical protein
MMPEMEELAARLQAVLSGASPLRVNPELMVHGHAVPGQPEPVTIYKSDPGESGRSDLYQTAVQVGDTTHTFDVDFGRPGVSDEVLLAIAHDRLQGAKATSPAIRTLCLKMLVSCANEAGR